MKKENDELLENLRSLDDNDIEELSDMVNFLDDDAKKRIVEKCMQKTSAEKRNDIVMTNNENEIKGVDVYMKKKFNKGIFASVASVAVIVGVIGAFALTRNNEKIKNPDVLTGANVTTSVVTQTTLPTVTTGTAIITEPVTETITEPVTETVSDNVVTVYGKDRIAVSKDVEYEEDWYDVDKFIAALNSNDSEYIASVIMSNKSLVDTWINKVKVNSYNIIGTFSEVEYHNHYILVEIDVAESDNDVFKKGKNLYRFYAGPLGLDPRPIITDDQTFDDFTEKFNGLYPPETTEEKNTALALSYDAWFGAEFTEGNADVIFNTTSGTYAEKNMYTCLASLFEAVHPEYESFYFNFSDKMSEETFISEMEKILSFKNLKEDFENYAYDYGYNQDGPVGYSHEFIVSASADKVVINYYGDDICLALAKTVEYSFSKNSDGSYCLTSVKNTYDSGFNNNLCKIK